MYAHSHSLKLNGPELQQLAEQLGGLAGISFLGPVRKAANVLLRDWRRRIPKPGYPGDKSPKAALSKSMRSKVRHIREKDVYYAVVGSDTKTGAYHSQLVEEGHRLFSHGKDTGERARGFHYGESSVVATARERDDTILAEVTKLVRKQLE